MPTSRLLVVMASLVAAAGANAQDFARAALPESYPLIGRWRAELHGSGCVETLEIRADGTRSVASDRERSESEFRMSWAPSADDFYRWEDRITKTNGQPGCSGSAKNAGQMSVHYLRLHPDGGRFLLCAKEEMTACFAEFFYQAAAMGQKPPR